MSLIPLDNIVKFKDNKDTPKIGKVINNKDPKKAGRIKVAIEGIFTPKDNEGSNLPWIRKAQDSFLAGSQEESFSVPEVGSIVQIVWPYDNKHAFYKAVPYGEQNQTQAFQENYPHESGITVGDLIIKFDRPTHSVVIQNNNGFKITADATGDVVIEGARMKISSETDLLITTPTMQVDGDLNVTGSIYSDKAASGLINACNSAIIAGGIARTIE